MFILHLHMVVAVVSALNAEIDNHPCLDNNLSIITVWLAHCTMFNICCCCCSFSTSIHSIIFFPTMHWEKETMIDERQWEQQQRQQREAHLVVFIRRLKTSERAPKENEAEEWYSDISQALPIASKVHHNKNIECKQHECSLFAWKKCCGNTHRGLSLYCLLLFQFIKIFHWIPTNCITQRKNHIYTIQRSLLDQHIMFDASFFLGTQELEHEHPNQSRFDHCEQMENKRDVSQTSDQCPYHASWTAMCVQSWQNNPILNRHWFPYDASLPMFWFEIILSPWQRSGTIGFRTIWLRRKHIFGFSLFSEQLNWLLFRILSDQCFIKRKWQTNVIDQMRKMKITNLMFLWLGNNLVAYWKWKEKSERIVTAGNRHLIMLCLSLYFFFSLYKMRIEWLKISCATQIWQTYNYSNYSHYVI